MEIKDILKSHPIIGVINNYKSTIKINGKVKNLNIKNASKALKMVLLDDSILEKDIKELSISELWKIELAIKLEEKIIIIGNMYNSLIHKDREYMKKLFKKLCTEYNKKIIIIDNNINSFINVVEKVVVINKKDIVYITDNYFDKDLYKYIKIPKIVDFIKYVNKDGIKVNETTEIYELLKDIYRRVS